MSHNRIDSGGSFNPDSRLTKAILKRICEVAQNYGDADRTILFTTLDNNVSFDPRNQPRIYLQTDEEIKFLIGVFGSAANFVNWYVRTPSNMKDGKDSYAVIQDYAQRDPKTVPPLTEITAYLFPDVETIS
jgi:hypothetical protein